MTNYTSDGQGAARVISLSLTHTRTHTHAHNTHTTHTSHVLIFDLAMTNMISSYTNTSCVRFGSKVYENNICALLSLKYCLHTE